MRDPKLYIVDDDVTVVRGISHAAELTNIQTCSFDSAESFLKAYSRDQAGCLLVDFRLPGMSGLELVRQLNISESFLSTIMMSGHGNVSTAVQAMRLGSMWFLEKPFALRDVLQVVERGIADSIRRGLAAERRQQVEDELKLLTAKEMEVLELLAFGHSNKEIASRLGKSVRAIEDRRARMMKRLGARQISDVIHSFFVLRPNARSRATSTPSTNNLSASA